MKKLILLSLITLIPACQNAKIENTYPQNPENIRNFRAGKAFGDINIFGGKPNEKPASKKEENPPRIIKNQLWISSLEVISTLLPIDTADEKSGLIITEWYQDGQNKDERIKINLLVKGSEVVKENLVLNVFKQKKDSKDNWAQEQSSSQNLSAQLIRDKIIEKAKVK